MLWIVLGLLAAFFESTKQVLRKHITKKYSPLLIAWYSTLFALCILVIPVLFMPVPELTSLFWLYLFIAGAINAFTLVLIIKALQETDLSLVSSLYSFSPVFVLLTAIFFLKEIPSFFGVLGVLLIVIGSLLINVKKHSNPFTNMFSDSGQKKILLAALLWAFSSNYYKLGIQETTPYFFVMSLYLFIVVVLFPFVFRKLEKPSKELVFLGIITSVVSLAQWVAANLTFLAYALSLKRLSVMFSLFFAKRFFKEKHMRWKFFGAIVMLLGVFFIVLV